MSTLNWMAPVLLIATMHLAARGTEPASANLPKVVLVGDSIRMSYAAVVAKALEGKAHVVGPKANGGDSGNVLKHLEEWVIRERPAVVHFNCGIHDTKRFLATGQFQVPPDAYEANLRKIVAGIRQETGATVLFATTTPILDARAAAARAGRDYELLDKSIGQYNDIARRVMQELRVPVNDLHSAVTMAAAPHARDDLISSDGVHLTATGQALVGKAVAQFIEGRLPASK